MVALAAAVALAFPSGFVSRPALSQRVQALVHRPATVLCARTGAAWRAERQAGAHGPEALARADVPRSLVLISPATCGQLLTLLRRGPARLSRATLARSAGALEVLAHQAEHLAGFTDEGVAECAAVEVLLPLAQSFRVRAEADLQFVRDAAWRLHAAWEAAWRAYRGPCR